MSCRCVQTRELLMLTENSGMHINGGMIAPMGISCRRVRAWRGELIIELPCARCWSGDWHIRTKQDSGCWGANRPWDDGGVIIGKHRQFIASRERKGAVPSPG